MLFHFISFAARTVAFVLMFVSATSALAQSPHSYKLISLPQSKSHVQWPVQAPRTVITYKLLTGPRAFADGYNCPQMDAFTGVTDPLGLSQQRVRHIVERAFDVWSQHANIEFREAATADEANILIGSNSANTSVSKASTGIQVGEPLERENFRRLDKAAICFDSTETWQDENFVSADVLDIGATLVHEIGHALGLDHAPKKASVMYSRHRYDPLFLGLSAGDIEGIQYLYGAPVYDKVSALSRK